MIKQITLNEIPVKSATSNKEYHPRFENNKWICDCKHYQIHKTDCRHILIKKLQLKNLYNPGGVKDTSIDAYVEILADPEKLNDRYKTILLTLEESEIPLTDMELSKKLGYDDPNRVRPRRNELADPNHFYPCLVEAVGKRECSISKKKCYVWDLTDYGQEIVRSL